jgi:hypothetical protein
MSVLDPSSSIPLILVSWPATLHEEAAADVSGHQPEEELNKEIDQDMFYTMKHAIHREELVNIKTDCQVTRLKIFSFTA